jgi:hypothetical protein
VLVRRSSQHESDRSTQRDRPESRFAVYPCNQRTAGSHHHCDSQPDTGTEPEKAIDLPLSYFASLYRSVTETKIDEDRRKAGQNRDDRDQSKILWRQEPGQDDRGKDLESSVTVLHRDGDEATAQSAAPQIIRVTMVLKISRYAVSHARLIALAHLKNNYIIHFRINLSSRN